MYYSNFRIADKFNVEFYVHVIFTQNCKRAMDFVDKISNAEIIGNNLNHRFFLKKAGASARICLGIRWIPRGH